VSESAFTFRCDDDFEPEKIFSCGQCFRWNASEDGSFVGVAFSRAARVSKRGDEITISGTEEDYAAVWRDYFDLGRRYDEIRERLGVDEYMREAIEDGRGIRILRQEPWEALCSFIISQCNHIPRIKGIVERFCALFGEPIAFEGGVLHAFPTAEKTASLTEEDLTPLRCGYRAKYVLSAARAVSEGRIALEELARGSQSDALCALKTIDGVGDKVAACVMLFGLGFYDAFPRDVWIKRALAERYGGDFDLSRFGGCAGIAQQYLFWHRRRENTED